MAYLGLKPTASARSLEVSRLGEEGPSLAGEVRGGHALPDLVLRLEAVHPSRCLCLPPVPQLSINPQPGCGKLQIHANSGPIFSSNLAVISQKKKKKPSLM